LIEGLAKAKHYGVLFTKKSEKRISSGIRKFHHPFYTGVLTPFWGGVKHSGVKLCLTPPEGWC
jgi:hypothetical protein